QYTLTGPDLDRLIEYTGAITKKLKAIPGAVDVDTTLVTGNPEVVATVNRRKAADLGVNVLDVAGAPPPPLGRGEASRCGGGGREGLALRGGRPRVRHPRARRRELPQQRRGAGRAQRAVVEARDRAPHRRGRPQARRRAVEDRPAGAPAAGDLPRQHLAGRRL